MAKAIVLRVVVGLLAFLLAVSIVEAAQAAEYSAWRTVTFDPYGSKGVTTDAVRVRHSDSGTRCDFLRLDRYDVKLVSLDAPVRSCIPGRVITIR
jgi:hypothetical protein